jgi:AraC-like DNA-binding protein
MSKTRQKRDPEAGLLLRSYAVTQPAGSVIAWGSLDWGQLAYASRGVMNVHTEQGTWVVPPHRAVWIPAGVDHRVEMSGRVSVRTLYFARRLLRGLPRTCLAVNVPPLLRELVLHAVRIGILHRDVPSEVRLVRVLLDQIQTLAVVPLQLPMPSDPRARRAAELLRQEPGEGRSLAQAARSAGASRRTLERLFLRETHMTLGRWRQRLRLVESLRLLAAGHAVTRVALDVGYNSPSAFVSAFRRQLGTTPARYFAPPRVQA